MMNIYIFFLIILFLIIVEIISRKLIKKTFLYKKWYFKPHIFLNFIGNNEYVDKKVKISSENFRLTNPNLQRENKNCYNFYLMGDCTFFENHLFSEETFAYKLEQYFSNIIILNPSMSHYTHYHMLNRFIHDVKNSKKIDFLISSPSVNDALVYIHHKSGRVKNDYSHFYKTFLDPEKYSHIKKIPSAFVQLIFLFLSVGNFEKLTNYETHINEINKSFQKESNYKIAKELFDLSILENYLNLLLAICNNYKIKLILSTFAYNLREFKKEPRITYLQSIKKINNLYREFSKKNNLLLIDFESEIDFDEKDIENKWQFCESGNEKRATLACKILENYYEELKKKLQYEV